MDTALPEDLRSWVKQKVETGEYPSEAAVLEAALTRLRSDERRGDDDPIDHEFIAYCEREADEGVTLDEVLDATSKIKDSMARVIIEEERAERL